MPVPDALFLFIEISYKMLSIQCNSFRYDTIAHSLGEYHEIYMNVRTLKTGLDPGSWIVDVPFKTGLVVWLVKLISSAFFRFVGHVL